MGESLEANFQGAGKLYRVNPCLLSKNTPTKWQLSTPFSRVGRVALHLVFCSALFSRATLPRLSLAI